MEQRRWKLREEANPDPSKGGGERGVQRQKPRHPKTAKGRRARREHGKREGKEDLERTKGRVVQSVV